MNAVQWIHLPKLNFRAESNIMLNHLKIHSRSWFPDAINSIRRLATTASGNLAKPMTSVFYDVIRLESIRGRSNVLIESIFDGCWGIWTPKCCRPSCWPQKGTSYVTTRVWAVAREIPCTGCFSRRVRGKNKNKKERPYISRISPGAPLRPIGTNCGLRVRLVDLINCAKFYRNRLRGLDSMSGQILAISIGLRYRR